jgi:light-regulated signal transduction histidine kinase (bacteriophytochrome)
LAGVVSAVSKDRNYSIRVENHGRDEVGRLIDGFNDMLSQIEVRDAALARSQHELEQRVQDRTRELEAFSYSVSHDLRAPLRHIGGFAELLVNQSGSRLDESGRRYLDKIGQAARRMGILIDELLQFSRMNQIVLDASRVDLGAMVHEIITDMEHDTAGRVIDWRLGSLPEADADPSMLRQVFANLIGNAVKYTGTRAEAEIEIGSIPGDGSEVVVFVRDNGVGFDMQYADKLFGVFQRLHRADEFEGTGIGLANVRRIVERHGGKTWAEGRVDRGAIFYFSLPLRAAMKAYAS